MLLMCQVCLGQAKSDNSLNPTVKHSVNKNISILPGKVENRTTASDVHSSPDGKFLLVANQYGNNMIVFKVNPTGMLEPTPHFLEISTPAYLKF